MYIRPVDDSDARLLYDWREGQQQAGQQLFKRYYGPVARFFANKIRESPGDLVQETFMACVKGRDRIREDSNFRSYLFGVAYRVLTRYLRAKYEAPADLSNTSVLDLDPGPSTIMHRSEEVRLLLRALRTLPFELQVVVDADKLRTFDVTLQEVADATRNAIINVAGGSLNIGAKRPLVAVSGLLEKPDSSLIRQLFGDL